MRVFFVMLVGEAVRRAVTGDGGIALNENWRGMGRRSRCLRGGDTQTDWRPTAGNAGPKADHVCCLLCSASVSLGRALHGCRESHKLVQGFFFVSPQQTTMYSADVPCRVCRIPKRGSRAAHPTPCECTIALGCCPASPYAT